MKIKLQLLLFLSTVGFILPSVNGFIDIQKYKDMLNSSLNKQQEINNTIQFFDDHMHMMTTYEKTITEIIKPKMGKNLRQLQKEIQHLQVITSNSSPQKRNNNVKQLEDLLSKINKRERQDTMAVLTRLLNNNDIPLILVNGYITKIVKMIEFKKYCRQVKVDARNIVNNMNIDIDNIFAINLTTTTGEIIVYLICIYKILKDDIIGFIIFVEDMYVICDYSTYLKYLGLHTFTFVSYYIDPWICSYHVSIFGLWHLYMMDSQGLFDNSLLWLGSFFPLLNLQGNNKKTKTTITFILNYVLQSFDILTPYLLMTLFIYFVRNMIVNPIMEAHGF